MWPSLEKKSIDSEIDQLHQCFLLELFEQILRFQESINCLNEVLNMLNELLEEAGAKERIWHCWGEKGGESLFIFMTPEQQKIIEDSPYMKADPLTQTISDFPW